MDPNEFLRMSPEDQQKALAGLRGLLGALESKTEDARDGNVVWIQNRHGVRDVCVYRHWRTYLSRHPEMGCRLLDPSEVVVEEAQVAQAAAVRAEKARLWRLLPFKRRDEFGGPDAVALEDLREMVGKAEPVDQLGALEATIRELQAQIAQQASAPAPTPRRRNRGRPRAESAPVAAE